MFGGNHYFSDIITDMFRTRQLGHITLYSNEKGKWTHASVAKTNALEELMQARVSPEEYRKRLLQQVSDESRANELLRRDHKPVRWSVKNWLWMIRKFGLKRSFHYWRGYQTSTIVTWPESLVPSQFSEGMGARNQG